MEIPPRILILLIIITILILMMNHAYRFQPNLNVTFQCTNYVTNTLLYVLLSIFIYLLVVQTFPLPTTMQIVIIVVAVFVLLFALYWTFSSQSNLWFRHFLWLLFVICLGWMNVQLYQRYHGQDGVFWPVFYKVILSMVLLSILIGVFPNLLPDAFGGILFTSLLTLVVVELLYLSIMFFNQDTVTQSTHKSVTYWFSLLTVFIFIGYTLWDTQMLLRQAKRCTRANYLTGSVNFFLDFLNLFTGSLSLQSN